MRSPAILLCSALLAISPGASAWQTEEPGIGPVCLYAMVSLGEEIGKRCSNLHDERIQAVMSASVQKLDAYFAKGGWTAEQMATFKRKQARVGVPDPEGLLCKGDAVSFYPESEAAAAQVVALTDRIVSKPRPLEWGDCL